MDDKDLFNKCNIFNYESCRGFYLQQINNNSKCATVKDKFEFTKNFSKEKYNQYNDICNSLNNKYENECKKSFSKYEKCFNKDLNQLSNKPYSSEFIQGCSDFKSEECNNFYKNIDEIINENPFCSLLKEINSIDYVYNKMFNKYYFGFKYDIETYTKICENVSSSKNYKNELCENELKKYNKCQIDISTDMNDEDIINNCEIFKENFCVEFYQKLIANDSPCSVIENKYEFIKSFNQEKYNQFDNTCNSVENKYSSKCEKDLYIYNKCFKTDIKEMYDKDPNSDELKQGCFDLKTKECIKFFNKNRKSILKEIPSCFTFSEYYSPEYVLVELIYRYYFKNIHYHNDYMEICSNINI